MNGPTALITGVTGQDGAYLAELLLHKGYVVYGMLRSSSSPNTARIDHLIEQYSGDGRFVLRHGDMTDTSSIGRILLATQPTEVYNLAAQSHVHVSFDTPEYTSNVGALGALRLLEALRDSGLHKSTRFYQASTSELFGRTDLFPQTEETPFHPRSPYAVAKLYAYWITINYREAYGLFASNGILFNHEGPTRGLSFVTRKITRAVASIELGLQIKVTLGNLEAKRDWGHARDFAEGMWRILQHSEPDDFLLATGEMRSVREFAELAFHQVGRQIQWIGRGLNEKGIDAATGQILIDIDEKYFRPAENHILVGDARKARAKLGWQPSISFEELVAEMVRSDLASLARGRGADVPPNKND